MSFSIIEKIPIQKAMWMILCEVAGRLTVYNLSINLFKDVSSLDFLSRKKIIAPSFFEIWNKKYTQTKKHKIIRKGFFLESPYYFLKTVF